MADLKPGIALLAKALAEAAPLPEAPRTVTLSFGGRKADLTFGPQRPLAGSVRHSFIGAAVDLPQATLDWLIAPLGVTCPADPIQREMLVELACIDLLTTIEAAFEAPDATSPPTTAYGIRAMTPSGVLELALHLSEPLTQALHRHLDRMAAPPQAPDPSQTVTVALRLGQQFLSAAEIAALSVRDVIMLEPGPMLLLATDGFAASVDLGASGATALSEVMPMPAPPARDDLHVCFHAAQTDLTLDALNTLEPGALLPFAAFADSAVDIVIGGRIAGRGQPITIGTGKGIRILHLSDKE